MKSLFFRAFVLLQFLLIWACGNNNVKKPIVTVTILPQQYFAQQIAGEYFDIHTMVPKGSSPESFDPSPSSLVQLNKSKAYFRIGGLGFELAWMNKLIQNNPHMMVFDTSKGISFLEDSHEDCADWGENQEECAEGHNHNHEGASDPHIWNSTKNAEVIAANMRDAFIQLDPKHRKEFETNYQNLIAQIRQTEDSLTDILKDLKGSSFLIYHPALTYWAHDYGLNQYSIENQGKEPSAAYIKALMDTVRGKNVRVIFIQQEFDSKNAQTIAKELNIPVRQINPLNYDWNQELIDMANALKTSQNAEPQNATHE